MTRREPWMVCLLSFVTCGFYGFYWNYVTTTELKQVSGREDLNPTTDLIIGIVTCGLYYLYSTYRNAQIVHEVWTKRSQPHEDKAQTILLLNVAALVVYVSAFIAQLILQDEYNKLATS